MTTLLKDQAFGLNILSENGFANLRYYDDALSVFSNGKWIDLIKEEIPFSLSYKPVSDSTWTTLTYNDEDELNNGLNSIREIGLVDVKMTAPSYTDFPFTEINYDENRFKIMFANLNSLDVSKVNVYDVTNMSAPFVGNENLGVVNLSNWHFGPDVVSEKAPQDKYYEASSFLTYHGHSYIDVSSSMVLNTTGWDFDTNDIGRMFYADFSNVPVVEGISTWSVQNITKMDGLFTGCNNFSDTTILSIVNMCLNAINVTVKNLSTTNVNSPLYDTKFGNSYYTSLHSALDAAGWTY